MYKINAVFFYVCGIFAFALMIAKEDRHDFFKWLSSL